MMKKILSISSVLLALLFFSCATSEAETRELQSPDTPEISDTSVTEESPAGTTVEAPVENPVETPDEKTEETQENASVLFDIEPQDKNNGIEGLEIPQDFEEPLVRDFVPEYKDEESAETQNNNADNSDYSEDIQKDLEEPVDESDLYPSDWDENAEHSDTEETEENDSGDSENAENSEDVETSENEENENNDDSENDSDELTDTDESLEGTENLESEAEPESEEVEPEIIIVPSRSVTLKKGENLAIIYPGSGWIYMGSLSEYNNMASKGRKLGSSDTKYTLMAKEAGTQIHHFYKEDNLTGEYIDDYIEIIVLEQRGSSKTTVTAPAYSEIVPKKPETPAKASEENLEKPDEIKSESKGEEKTVKSDKEKTESNDKVKSEKKADPDVTGRTEATNTTDITVAEIDATDSADADQTLGIDDDVISVEDDYSYAEQVHVNTDELLENAKLSYEQGSYEESLKYLTDFFEYAIDRQDEALYLQGQLLETDSSIKDIKGAVQAYELLVKNYPASTYWNDANKRIKYLRKFYYLSN